MTLKQIFILASSCLIGRGVFAAPPQDLSVFEKPEIEDNGNSVNAARRLRFKEEGVTAEAPAAPSRSVAPDPLGQSRQVRYDVMCRTQPGRSGAPKVKLKTGTIVVEAARSNQWSQVSPSPKFGCWVPSSALIK